MASNDDTTAAPGSTASPRRRTRSVLAGVLGGLALVGILASTITFWSHRLLLNTDAWVATVGPLADDPEVTDLLATRLTDQLLEATDAQQKIADALPEQAGVLAGPITAAADTLVTNGVATVLASDQFSQLWKEANRIAHESAVALLRGEPIAGFQVIEGTVVLNLLPLVDDALRKVDEVAPDLLTDGRPIPDITYDTPPDEAIADLEEALGRDLPDSFGVIEVFQSDQLAAAQDAVILFDRITWVLPVLTLALMVGSVVLAADRRRALVGLGLAIVVSAVLATAAGQAMRNLLTDLVKTPEARGAATATMATLLGDLRSFVRLILIGGTLVAVGAWLSGDGKVATSLRRGGARVVGRATGDPAGLPWVAEHRPALQVAGLVAGLGYLVLSDPSFTSLGATVLVIGIYEAGVWLLAGEDAGDGEHTAPPPAPDAPVGAEA